MNQAPPIDLARVYYVALMTKALVELDTPGYHRQSVVFHQVPKMGIGTTEEVVFKFGTQDGVATLAIFDAPRGGTIVGWYANGAVHFIG